MEVNFLPFISEALSLNKKVYKEIDTIYNKDKMRFIKLAKENTYYDHTIANAGNIEQNYYFRKALGLLLASKDDPDIAEEVINICRKGWNYVYAYLNQNNNIKLQVFMDNFIKKNGGIEKTTGDEINANAVILIFLANWYKKDIDVNDEVYILTMNSFHNRIAHYEKENRINIDNISKESKKDLRNLEKKIKNNNKIRFAPLDFKFSNKQNPSEGMNISTIWEIDKYLLAFEYIFDLEELELAAIVEKNFLSSKEIKELIFCYTHLFNNEEIDEEELMKYLYPAIQIRYLCKEYKKAKEYFFQNFNEQLYDEISSTENENREIKNTNTLLENENKRLELELENLKRENKRLELKVDTLEDNKSEIVALREFVFNIDAEAPVYRENELDYNLLNEVKGVIIGGHNTWQYKLKEVLKEWNFIAVDCIHFDEAILRNSDCIFINVNYISHAMYYKIMSIVNSNKKNIQFINNQNVDLCLNEIFKTISDY